MERCKPPMKWAGGKSQLLKELLVSLIIQESILNPFFEAVIVSCISTRKCCDC